MKNSFHFRIFIDFPTWHSLFVVTGSGRILLIISVTPLVGTMAGAAISMIVMISYYFPLQCNTNMFEYSNIQILCTEY